MAVGQSYVVYRGTKEIFSNIAGLCGARPHTAEMMGAGAGILISKPVALATADLVGSAATLADMMATMKRFGDGEAST